MEINFAFRDRRIKLEHARIGNQKNVHFKKYIKPGTFKLFFNGIPVNIRNYIYSSLKMIFIKIY